MIRTWQQGQDSGDTRAGKKSHGTRQIGDKRAGKAQLEQASRDRTAGTGQPGQNSRDISAGTRHPEEVSLDWLA